MALVCMVAFSFIATRTGERGQRCPREPPRAIHLSFAPIGVSVCVSKREALPASGGELPSESSKPFATQRESPHVRVYRIGGCSSQYPPRQSRRVGGPPLPTRPAGSYSPAGPDRPEAREI